MTNPTLNTKAPACGLAIVCAALLGPGIRADDKGDTYPPVRHYDLEQYGVGADYQVYRLVLQSAADRTVTGKVTGSRSAAATLQERDSLAPGHDYPEKSAGKKGKEGLTTLDWRTGPDQIRMVGGKGSAGVCLCVASGDGLLLTSGGGVYTIQADGSLTRWGYKDRLPINGGIGFLPRFVDGRWFGRSQFGYVLCYDFRKGVEAE